MIFRRTEITDKRQDIAPETEGLQVSAFTMAKGKTFRPHEHLPRPREIPRTQETWILLSGSVEVTYYDVGGGLLGKTILRAGDCSISLLGGHNYIALEDDTQVYEVKLGPFVGVAADKRHLD